MELEQEEDIETIKRNLKDHIGLPQILNGEIIRNEVDRGTPNSSNSMVRRLDYHFKWPSDLDVTDFIDMIAEIESRDSSLTKTELLNDLTDQRARAVIESSESSYSYDGFLTELENVISDENYPENISMLAISDRLNSEVIWRDEIDASKMINMYTDQHQIEYGGSLNQNIARENGEFERRKVTPNYDLDRFEKLIEETFPYQLLEDTEKYDFNTPEEILDQGVEEIRRMFSEKKDEFFWSQDDAIERLGSRISSQDY